MNWRSATWVVAAVVAVTGQLSATPPRAYINPAAPSVSLPAIVGTSNDVFVPDTLDLAERARLAVRGLTGPLDADDDYTLYWLVNFHNTPPVMKKEDKIHLVAKFMEALPLMRIMSGSQENAHIDQVWIDSFLKSIGPDGLPYARRSDPNEPFRSLIACGPNRALNALLIYHLLDARPEFQSIIERMIDRYAELTVERGDWGFIPGEPFTPGQAPLNDAALPGPMHVDYITGRLLQTLGLYYQATAYPPAKRLGDKLANYVRYHSGYFGPRGEWLEDQLDPVKYPGRGDDCHFGSHSHTLLYLLDYALGTENEDLTTYCRHSFDWAVNRNSTIGGQSATATRIGFFLEYLNPHYPSAETCSVADMIAVGLKLSQAGHGDYWDMVDGWVRNHFAECQIQSADWVERLRSPAWPRRCDPDETDVRVAERNVGNFLSWPVANDGCPSRPALGHVWSYPIGIMHCCSGNGARTLYYVWEHILQCSAGVLQIDLLLNRSSPWAEVKSFLPYQGRVEIDIATTLQTVRVRVPDWVPSGADALRCLVNGKPVAVTWSGRYVQTQALRPGDTVAVEFPMVETEIRRRVYGGPHETLIGGFEYERLVFRGHTVVLIEPQGQNYPFYQRAHYRNVEPRYRPVTRFHAETVPRW